MRVVCLLGVLCVVFATAHGQDSEAPVTESGVITDAENETAVETTTEDDTIRGEVVYTPHNRDNLILVKRSADAFPQTEPGDPEASNYDRNDDDYTYGRVRYSPDEREFPEPHSGSFDDLRTTYSPRGPSSNDIKDDDYNYGKVIYSPDERAQPESSSLDELRMILSKQGTDELKGKYDELTKELEEGGLFDGPSGRERPPVNDKEKESLKMLTENLLAVFNNVMKKSPVPPNSWPDFITNEEYTGMLDSVMTVGDNMQQVVSSGDHLKGAKRLASDPIHGDYDAINYDYKKPHYRHDLVNKRSADEPLYPELELRDVRKRRSFDDWSQWYEQKFRNLVDIRKKRFTNEQQYANLGVLRDRFPERRKRSDDTQTTTPHNDPSRFFSHHDVLNDIEIQKRSIIENDAPLPPFDGTEQSDITGSGFFGGRRMRAIGKDDISGLPNVAGQDPNDSAEEREDFYIPAELHEIDVAHSSYVPVNPPDMDVDYVDKVGLIQGRAKPETEEAGKSAVDSDVLNRAKRGSDVPAYSFDFPTTNYDEIDHNALTKETKNTVLPVEILPMSFDEAVHTVVEGKSKIDIGPEYTINAKEPSVIVHTQDVHKPIHSVVETKESRYDSYDKPIVVERKNIFDESVLLTDNVPNTEDESLTKLQDRPKMIVETQMMHKPIHSVVESKESRYDSFDKPIVVQRKNIFDESVLLTDNVPNTEDESLTKLQDRPKMIVETQMMHKPIHSVVESKESRYDSFDKPIVVQRKNIFDESVLLTDNVPNTEDESLTKLQDRPKMIVETQMMHKPIHSVVESKESRYDSYDKPIVVERKNIFDESVLLTDNVPNTEDESLTKLQDRPKMIVETQMMHKPIHSVVESKESRYDSFDKPIVVERKNIFDESVPLTDNVPNTEDESLTKLQDRRKMIVETQMMHKPIHSVVESKESRYDWYDKPTVVERKNILDESVPSTDNVPKPEAESLTKLEDHPTIIVDTQLMHKPIHSVVESKEFRYDTNDKSLMIEIDSVHQPSVVGQDKVFDNTVPLTEDLSKTIDESFTKQEDDSSVIVITHEDRKQLNADIESKEYPHDDEKLLPTVILTNTVDDPNTISTKESDSILKELTDKSHPDTIIMSNIIEINPTVDEIKIPHSLGDFKPTRVNDKEMILDDNEKEVSASSTKVPETTPVPVTEPTVSATMTPEPVSVSYVETDSNDLHDIPSKPGNMEDDYVNCSDEHLLKHTNDVLLSPTPIVDNNLGKMEDSKSTQNVPSTQESIDSKLSTTTPVSTTEFTAPVIVPRLSGPFARKVSDLIPIVRKLAEEALRVPLPLPNKQEDEEIDAATSRPLEPHDISVGLRGSVPAPPGFISVSDRLPMKPPKSDSDRIVPPLGFMEIPDYKKRISTSTHGPIFSDHPVVSIHDVRSDNVDDAYDDTSAKDNKKISGGGNKHPGGYDKNHGGHDDKHFDGFEDDHHDGYDKNHGGYDEHNDDHHQDGYDKNHGGYDKNHGGYDKNHGGYDDHHIDDCDDYPQHVLDERRHGGYDKNHGGYDKHNDDHHQDGYDKNHGGYDKNHGGYDKNHGGYDDQHIDDCDDYPQHVLDERRRWTKGYDKNHGGYDKQNDDHHHDGYDKNHGGYDKNHGGYDKNHGGYDDQHIDDCDDYPQHVLDERRHGGYLDHDDDHHDIYDRTHGGYDKNHGGYNPQIDDCDEDLFGGFHKNRGGYDKNRGGYNKNRGGYDKNRGGYDKDFDDCDDNIYDIHDKHRGRFDKNRGGYNKNRDGYNKNHGGHNKNRGGYDVSADCDDDGVTGYDKNRGGYDNDFGGYNKNRGGYDKNRGSHNKNHGGYNKNRGGYNKNRGGYNKHRDGYDKHYEDCDDDKNRGGYNAYNKGYINKHADPYVEYEEGHHGGPADIHYEAHVANHLTPNFDGYDRHDIDQRRAGRQQVADENASGIIMEPSVLPPGVSPRRFIPPSPLPLNRRMRPQIGDENAPGFVVEPNALPPNIVPSPLRPGPLPPSGRRRPQIEDVNVPDLLVEPNALPPGASPPRFVPPSPLLPNRRMRPQIGDENAPNFIVDPSISPPSFVPSPLRPRPLPPLVFPPSVLPSSDAPEDLDKDTYWHKLEIPLFGFEHEAQIQPLRKLKNIFKPRPPGSALKKDETFTSVKLGPLSMRVGLGL